MLKHNIKRVVVSPGGTHIELIAGMQYNNSFSMYSAIDERGAAYMAVGMAAETGEPVAILCTESVASRNYYPALTEAYYRQLPILAITGVHDYAQIGQLIPQIIDRSVSPKDTFRLKVHLPIIKDEKDIRESNLKINEALLELTRHGGGPVHINLPCSNNGFFFTDKTLYNTRVIHRYYIKDEFPDLPKGKVAIFVATHSEFSEELTHLIDQFCARYDAVVFCGHTSGYHGKYIIKSNILAYQKGAYEIYNDIKLVIHLGNHAADTLTLEKLKKTDEVWRVNPDGEIRDTFNKLTNIFEMREEEFFKRYVGDWTGEKYQSYYNKCSLEVKRLKPPVNKLPFSNVYAAAMISSKLPDYSLIHLGLSNTIRAWSLFEFPISVRCSSNVGTRGIDGVLSTFLGASLVNREKLCYCVIGDLSFFYDLNSLGNRDIGRNVRILLVNDGGGGLFKTSGSAVHKYLGDEFSNPYIAAAGHFGNKSSVLVKCYVEALGFEYLTASTKEEFDAIYERFLVPELTEKPMLFEIFTNSSDEREAFDKMSNIDITAQGIAKQVAKQILGQKSINAVRRLLNNEK